MGENFVAFSEVKEARAQMEVQILQMLRQFMTTYAVQVVSVDLDKRYTIGYRHAEISNVSVLVTL